MKQVNIYVRFDELYIKYIFMVENSPKNKSIFENNTHSQLMYEVLHDNIHEFHSHVHR